MSFHTALEANNFISDAIKLVDPNWRAFIPDEGLYRVEELDSDTLLKGFSCLNGEEVIKCERIKKTIETKNGKLSVNSK